MPPGNDDQTGPVCIFSTASHHAGVASGLSGTEQYYAEQLALANEQIKADMQDVTDETLALVVKFVLAAYFSMQEVIRQTVTLAAYSQLVKNTVVALQNQEEVDTERNAEDAARELLGRKDVLVAITDAVGCRSPSPVPSEGEIRVVFRQSTPSNSPLNLPDAGVGGPFNFSPDDESPTPPISPSPGPAVFANPKESISECFMRLRRASSSESTAAVGRSLTPPTSPRIVRSIGEDEGDEASCDTPSFAQLLTTVTLPEDSISPPSLDDGLFIHFSDEIELGDAQINVALASASDAVAEALKVVEEQQQKALATLRQPGAVSVKVSKVFLAILSGCQSAADFQANFDAAKIIGSEDRVYLQPLVSLVGELLQKQTKSNEKTAELSKRAEGLSRELSEKHRKELKEKYQPILALRLMNIFFGGAAITIEKVEQEYQAYQSDMTDLQNQNQNQKQALEEAEKSGLEREAENIRDLVSTATTQIVALQNKYSMFHEIWKMSAGQRKETEDLKKGELAAIQQQQQTLEEKSANDMKAVSILDYWSLYLRLVEEGCWDGPDTSYLCSGLCVDPDPKNERFSRERMCARLGRLIKIMQASEKEQSDLTIFHLSADEIFDSFQRKGKTGEYRERELRYLSVFNSGSVQSLFKENKQVQIYYNSFKALVSYYADPNNQAIRGDITCCGGEI